MSSEQFERKLEQSTPPVEEGTAARKAFKIEGKEGGEEEFFAERLVSPEDPRVEKVHKILADYFGKEEMDSPEVVKQAMTGRMETGEETPPYLIHIVENSKGEIKGVSTGAVVETVDSKGKISEKSGVSLDCYTFISPEMRGRLGVLIELVGAQEKSAEKDADRRGLKIKGYLTEAHSTTEQILNRKKKKRLYIETKEGFSELPYEQPPLDWDPKTGKPTKDAGVVQEHLMLKLTSEENNLSAKELMEMIRGMYYYNNYREEGYFKNPKAYQTHTKFVEGIEQKLTDFIGRKTVRLLSREERETMGKRGIKFIEHETEERKKTKVESGDY